MHRIEARSFREQAVEGNSLSLRFSCSGCSVLHNRLRSSFQASRIRRFYQGGAGRDENRSGILPTLIGLMTAVGVLRASGFLEFLSEILKAPAGFLRIPGELIPLILVRLVSSSAATGLLLDIFRTHGPDSLLGMTASIMESCTETVFYTMSVYFMTAKVTKTRWTLAGAAISTAAGIGASILIAGFLT